MDIQCECGRFRAQLSHFPQDTPGRLKCYCDDCQSFLHYLGRSDLLDANGGTEIIPVYPSDIKVTQGQEVLRCTRLKEDGMFRFSTTCCNTPVANTDAKRPWSGMHRRLFTVRAPVQLDQIFPAVRSSILGKYGHGQLPAGTPQTFDFKGFRIVVPFLLKGLLLGRKRPSPFFDSAGNSVCAPHVLTAEERQKCLDSARKKA